MKNYFSAILAPSRLRGEKSIRTKISRRPACRRQVFADEAQISAEKNDDRFDHLS